MPTHELAILVRNPMLQQKTKSTRNELKRPRFVESLLSQSLKHPQKQPKGQE